MINQLTIFDTIVDNEAYCLLDCLNDGLKGNDKYILVGKIKSNGKNIINAVNKSGNIVFNVLDENGKIPKDNSACWRSFCHIKNEFSL